MPVMDWGKGPYLVPGASLVTFHLITVRSQLPVRTKSPSHATQETFWAFVGLACPSMGSPWPTRWRRATVRLE